MNRLLLRLPSNLETLIFVSIRLEDAFQIVFAGKCFYLNIFISSGQRRVEWTSTWSTQHAALALIEALLLNHVAFNEMWRPA